MEVLIQQLMAFCGQKASVNQADEYWFDVPQDSVVKMAQFMLTNQVRLSTATALERLDGETDVIYHFVRGRLLINLRATTQQQALPSIANILPAANWIEREMHDLYAVQFTGHPNLRPLVRPKELPEGFFRKAISDALMKEKEGI